MWMSAVAGALALTAGSLASVPPGPPSTVTTPPDDGSTLPDGVAVSVEYPRYLQVGGEEVEVVFDNQSAESIEVTMLGLRVSGFDSPEPAAHHVSIRSGRRIDIKAPFGTLDCASEPSTATVVASVSVDGDEPIDVHLDIDPAPFQRIHESVCGRRDVLAAVSAEWNQGFTVDGDVVHTTLDVSLTGGTEASVNSMRGTVIFNIVPEPRNGSVGAPIATLDADHRSVSIPVTINVARCDAHAVIESKKSYLLPVWFTAGGRDDQFVTIEFTGDLRAELDRMVTQCLEANEDA